MTSKPTILVTGCSSGIGLHCARRLADDGWQVFVTARKDEDLSRLRAEGFEAFYLEHRDPTSIDQLWNDLLAHTGGRLDALFNNAGYSQPGAVEDLSIECLREQMEVNFFAYHQMIVRAVPLMRAQGHGRIVNCSSVFGRVCMPWRGAYTASKFALEGLTVTLRQELDGTGIFASLIEPGPIPSNIAINAVRYADKYINVEASEHRADYETRLAQLRAQEPPSDLSGAEPVYKALRHALIARRPKPHYAVTSQTRISLFANRVLPKDLFYRLLRSKA